MAYKKPGSKPDLPLRPCVGIALFNRQGRVWAGRRIDKTGGRQADIEGLWQLPQGGIEENETPFAAAQRELWEETGIKSVKFLAEIGEWLSYEMPANILAGENSRPPLGGKYRGQTQKWFAFLFIGKESEIAVNPPPAGNETEFDAWEWRDLAEVAEHIIGFKRDVYRQMAAEFAPLAGNLRKAAEM